MNFFKKKIMSHGCFEYFRVGSKIFGCPRPILLNFGSPDVLGEAFTTSSAGQDFWELQTKNIWGLKVRNNFPKYFELQLPQSMTTGYTHILLGISKTQTSGRSKVKLHLYSSLWHLIARVELLHLFNYC